jgi:cell division protein FtsA
LAKDDVIVGLDIGTTKVCAVAGQATGDGIEVLGVGVAPSSGIKAGVVVDLDAATHAIAGAADKAQRMSGVEIHSAFVGVTGQHLSSQNCEGVVAVAEPDHEITQDDVARVLEAARLIALPPEREILHTIPRGYSVDGMGGVRSPVGMSGSRLEVQTHIVTGTTTFLTNVEKCVDRAGIGIQAMVLQPLATSEACLTPAEKDLGVVLIDIGGGTTDVAVFVNGSIYHTAVVPVGGIHVTRDIAVGMRTNHNDAERLKLSHGCAVARVIDDADVIDVPSTGDREIRQLPRRVLAEIIEPRMQEIFTLALAAIEDSGHQDLLGAGAVLAGGGSLIDRAAECAQGVLGLPVRIGYPAGVSGITDAVDGPEFGTGVGLVLYGARRQEEKGDRAVANVGSLWRSVRRMFGRRR